MITANNALKDLINDTIGTDMNNATLTIRTGAGAGANNTATGTVLDDLTLTAGQPVTVTAFSLGSLN
jgi:molybdopterin-binding protein